MSREILILVKDIVLVACFVERSLISMCQSSEASIGGSQYRMLEGRSYRVLGVLVRSLLRCGSRECCCCRIRGPSGLLIVIGM